MAKLTLTPLGLLVLPFVFVASLNAQTTTDPVGVVKITIAAAPVNGTKLTAISATLRGAIEYQGTATSVGTFSSSSQTLSTGVTTWSAAKWTADPHLCYIENAAGAEEAYLISSMDESTGVLTLATIFDITTRYTSTPTFRICKAQTLGSLFGTSSVPFLTGSAPSNADSFFAWDGDSWHTYFHNGSSWQDDSTAFGGDVNDAVIFPDEGIFVLRRETTNVTLTFSGSVPTKAQITTIPGEAFSFVSNRYPVGTVLSNLGYHNLTNWVSGSAPSNADTVYIWNVSASSWTSYWYNGADWKSDANAFGGDSNNIAIDSDTAMFVLRRGVATPTSAANKHGLPYAP